MLGIRRTALGALIAIAVTVLVVGCAPGGGAGAAGAPAGGVASAGVAAAAAAPAIFPLLSADPDVEVLEDLRYGTARDGSALLLDVCLPGSATSEARPAIVSIHGGSWARGDKGDVAWRAVCRWLASEGFVTFSLNYRLVPAVVFPAAVDDVQAAVRWVRSDSVASRFGVDPQRIGAFGGSAGGNLAALLGVSGSGSVSAGSRVAAVAALSGPMDLTGRHVTEAFAPVQLEYLGCAEYSTCDAAKAASPVFQADETDPPFFVGHALAEMIPVEQAAMFVSALRKAGVPVEYVTVGGALHSLELLDETLSGRVVDFFRARLGAPAEPPVVEAPVVALTEEEPAA
ncbi:alpha/beta hydrolase [Salinibacterium sp. ZJ454]|uniref:alpha/beta hydrolase n=1 Tax=Salinibacterium sp. ZJ454 TaxID=2708339 RepID=UPI00142415E5|nr:alpha/beta hydrolase [Salinibacterium sp. ZJ454]